MNAEFFQAIEAIEKEKGIPRLYMYDKIRQAMLAAFRKDHPESEDNVEVLVEEDKKRIEMIVTKQVVNEVEDAADPGRYQEVRPHRRPGRQAGGHPGYPRGGARHRL